MINHSPLHKFGGCGYDEFIVHIRWVQNSCLFFSNSFQTFVKILIILTYQIKIDKFNNNLQIQGISPND